jgi:hypothetical protein
LVKSKGIHYYKCNTKGCNCNRNAEELHGQFTHILNQYSLNSASLAPLIKQQTLATYYKLTEEGEDDTAIYESRLKEIDYNIERQKTRLKKEELPYKFYLEFEADFQKEKKKIQEELTPGSKGVSNPELCVEFAVTYSTKLAPVWSSASYTDKQSLQFLLFPEGIFYKRVEDSCRTTGVNDAFAYIAHQERLLQE